MRKVERRWAEVEKLTDSDDVQYAGAMPVAQLDERGSERSRHLTADDRADAMEKGLGGARLQVPVGERRREPRGRVVVDVEAPDRWRSHRAPT